MCYLRGVQEDAASQSDQFRRRRRARVYIAIAAASSVEPCSKSSASA